MRYWQAYCNKITNKIFGIIYLKTKTKRKGVVLLSFITGPFTITPGEYFTDPHSHYWVCAEIARLFLERGFDVDVIDWNNNTFIPKKKYAVCIDLQRNLRRFSPFLRPNCIKIMHIVSAYVEFQNMAEKKRIDDLKKRRGISLVPKRIEYVSNNPKYANFLAGYGNKTIYATYAQFGKTIIPIHEPVSMLFNFPENKDFKKSQKQFLWFGGGGAVHKGLDIILEAFAELPHLHLHIVGPVRYETDFIEAYKKELSYPNVSLHDRPRFDNKGNMTVDGKPFKEITDQCAALVYLSCSEGTSGAAIQAMHAGLFPIITPQTGVDESAPSIIVKNPTVENIRKIIEDFSNLPAEKVEEMARHVWSFARSYYSKEEFTKSYNKFIDEVFKL